MQMDLSNVGQLVVPPTQPPERRDHTQGPEREAEFLSLRLLNKRARVRLSPAGIDYSRLPGKSSLFAVGNRKGWFAAAIRKEDSSNYILVSNLSDLRTAFESGHADPGPFIPFTSQRSPFHVPGLPTILKFALNDERLLIGFLEGPILLYDTADLFALDQPSPIFTIPGAASTIPRDISPNPGDSPELVAIMRGVHGQEPGHQLDVFDVQVFKHVAGWRRGSDPNTAPVSISWSPKGKQIAVGLQSGDILLYSPLSARTPKSHLPKPSSIPGEASSLLSTTWLSNPTFYSVFSTPEASSTLFDPLISESPPQTHLISIHDSKARSAHDVELRDPCPPFGARRPPGSFSVVLRNWNPTKFIMICGGGPSSDIGIIGALSSDDPSKPEDQWMNLILEETSTPSLPLDEELNDLALLGLDVDLTSSRPIRVSEQPDDGTPDFPPSPVLYAYTNDGTIVSWYILNNNREAYPGMNAAAPDVVPSSQGATYQETGVKSFITKSATALPTIAQESVSIFDQKPATSPSPVPSIFGQASTSSGSVAPAQGFGAFGNVSKPTQFGSLGFGFGGGSAHSAFGQPSAAPAPDSTRFGASSNSQGEQANLGPSSAFGTPGFGGATQPTQQKPASSSAFGTAGFGQTSGALAFGAPAFGSKLAAPAFGQSSFGTTPLVTAKAASAFESTSGGFASFATQGSSAFGAPVKSTSTSKPKSASPPAFGAATSFGRADLPAAPQSAFGAGGVGQPSTGASPSTSFGQQTGQLPSVFGKPVQAVPPTYGKVESDSSTNTSTREISGFGNFGTLGDALTPSISPARFGSPSGSPPSPSGSLPDSPELRPMSQPAKATSSYLKAAEGFGALNTQAFGGAEKSSTSSFIKPAAGFGASLPQKSPTSVFGQQKPVASSTPSSVPTFGATSTLGHAKPIFGTSSFGTIPQQAVTEPSKPISGGFGAFSSGGGAFASFANAGKSPSFTDILSSGDPDKAKPKATPLVFGSASPSKAPEAPVFAVLNEHEVSSTPVGRPAGTPPTPTGDGGGLGSEKEGGNDRFSKGQQPSPPSAEVTDVSFNFSTLKTATSQVTISSTSKPTASASEIDGGSMTENAESGEGPREDEVTASRHSPLIGDGPKELESDDEAQAPRSPTPSLPDQEDPTYASLPIPSESISRHAEQSTQKTKAPEVNPSSPFVELAPPLSNVLEASTTPPGSPQMPVQTAKSGIPLSAAPTPIIPFLANSPLGLGLGRPSSKPIRSSPLAVAPITSANDEEPELKESPSMPTATNAKSSSQKKPSSPWSSTTPIPSIAPSVALHDFYSLTGRQKTPLLTTQQSMSCAVPQVSGSSITPDQPRVSPPASKTPTSVPMHAHIVSPVTDSIPLPAADNQQEEYSEHPMQIEFLRAYQEMADELVQLHKKAQEMALIRPVISEPRGLDKFLLNDRDFVPGKYSHGDLKAFGTLVGNLQKKVLPLLELEKANKRSLSDLQNLCLMSEAKQEEMARWERARQDPEFANTLKPRTLGPEHAEIQMRLRKRVQVVRERVQQCEDKMESLKKRLEQHKSRKLGFRPPSLDTIDRTCRNIQVALEERTKRLEHLQDRIEALSPKASQRLQTSQVHTRLPAPKAGSVTPPFANVAAAALNYEQSSLKLKNALLAARKEPLLTTEVVKLAPPRVVESNMESPSQARPEWKLPPVPHLDSLTSSQPISPVSRRTGRAGKRHGAVQLKESTPELGAKTIVFDWGPLPGAAPMHELSADVRSSREKAVQGQSVAKSE